MEPKLNRRTDGAYTKDHEKIPDHLRYLNRRQSSANVVVWAAVTTSGKKSHLVFVEQGVKIDTEKYLFSILHVWRAWGRIYLFMHNGAPAHTSKCTQSWCKQQLHDFPGKTEWPPSSLDLIPMDYSI